MAVSVFRSVCQICVLLYFATSLLDLPWKKLGCFTLGVPLVTVHRLTFSGSWSASKLRSHRVAFSVWFFLPIPPLQVVSRSGEAQTQKLRSHPLRTKGWVVLSFKCWSSQNIAVHASPTARDFFSWLISTFPVRIPCRVLPVLAVAYAESCVDQHNTIKWVTPVIVTDNWCRFPCWVPAEYKQAPKTCFILHHSNQSKICL